jgi:hypothetical protein
MKFKLISKTDAPGRHERTGKTTILHRRRNLLFHAVDDKTMWDGPAMANINLTGINGEFADQFESGAVVDVTFKPAAIAAPAASPVEPSNEPEGGAAD